MRPVWVTRSKQVLGSAVAASSRPAPDAARSLSRPSGRRADTGRGPTATSCPTSGRARTEARRAGKPRADRPRSPGREPNEKS